jgi:hypothetical protein
MGSPVSGTAAEIFLHYKENGMNNIKISQIMLKLENCK